jgi:hypothetical protein
MLDKELAHSPRPIGDDPAQAVRESRHFGNSTSARRFSTGADERSFGSNFSEIFLIPPLFLAHFRPHISHWRIAFGGLPRVSEIIDLHHGTATQS